MTATTQATVTSFRHMFESSEDNIKAKLSHHRELIAKCSDYTQNTSKPTGLCQNLNPPPPHANSVSRIPVRSRILTFMKLAAIPKKESQNLPILTGYLIFPSLPF